MSWQFRSLCSLTHRNSDICVKYHLLFAHCSMKYQQFKNISMSYHLELLSSLLANCMLANTGAQRECPVNFHSKWLQTTWLIFAHNSFQRIPLFLREIKHSKTNTLKYELKNYFKNNRQKNSISD